VNDEPTRARRRRSRRRARGAFGGTRRPRPRCPSEPFDRRGGEVPAAWLRGRTGSGILGTWSCRGSVVDVTSTIEERRRGV